MHDFFPNYLKNEKENSENMLNDMEETCLAYDQERRRQMDS